MSFQVLLGSWERGQEYINDIIENLNHWATGWTDWNLALDMNGGGQTSQDMADMRSVTNCVEVRHVIGYFSAPNLIKYVTEADINSNYL